MVQLNREQLEQLEDGTAIFYHSDTCGEFCDYACNEPVGSLIAEAYNQGREEGTANAKAAIAKP